MDKGKGKISLPKAFSCAFAGIAAAFMERNFRIELCFAALAVVLGIALGVPCESWLAIIICCMVVLGLECVNSAVEAAVDLAMPDEHPLAKVAKDCAAGAVLLASIGSLVVAAVIYIPPIIRLLGW